MAPMITTGWRRFTLSLVSPDGDQGYPGRLDVRLTYRLDERRRIAHRVPSDDFPTAR